MYIKRISPGDGQTSCKVWLTSVERRRCSNEAKTRNQLKFAGVGCAPKLANRFQPLVGRSSPYCEDMCRRYCCLTFFPIVDTCLSCEDIARQLCAIVLTAQMPFLRNCCAHHYGDKRRSTSAYAETGCRNMAETA